LDYESGARLENLYNLKSDYTRDCICQRGPKFQAETHTKLVKRGSHFSFEITEGIKGNFVCTGWSYFILVIDVISLFS
jgi:hypothetical protein